MTFPEGFFPKEEAESPEEPARQESGRRGPHGDAPPNGASRSEDGAPSTGGGDVHGSDPSGPAAAAGPDPDAGATTALAETAEAKELLARERDEYLLALQRTQADFENYRKRIARQQAEQSARAAADLVGKLLPVLDALDLAEAHLNESLDLSEDGKALRATKDMFNDILAKEGLERVDRSGVPFDPSVHDAVAHSEGDGEDGETIVEEVLRSGYRWKGNVLRPAMVRVRG